MTRPNHPGEAELEELERRLRKEALPLLIGERDPARPAGPHHHRGGGLRAASTEP